MTHASKSVELATGVTLDYAEQGDSSGIPVIFVHGVTDSWRSFECVLPHIPRHVRAFAVSQRGHGEASRPAAGYRTRDFAADINAFVQKLDLGPCVVVGHSMGSTHALRFAIDYPQLARALVLVGAFASYRAHPPVRELCESMVSLEAPLDPAFVRDFQLSTLASPVPPEFLDMVVQESLKMPARVWRAVFAGFLEDDFAGELGRVKAPTLILWGDRDAICSRVDQETLLRSLAGSRLIAYDGVGHALHWEQPQRFAADLVRFCDSLVQAASPALPSR